MQPVQDKNTMHKDLPQKVQIDQLGESWEIFIVFRYHTKKFNIFSPV